MNIGLSAPPAAGPLASGLADMHGEHPETAPAFFAEKDAHEDWYRRLFIAGDIHFSAAGNRLIFREVAKRLL